MLLAVLSVCSNEELADMYPGQTGAETPAPTPEEIERIKNKIIAAGKMYKVFQLLRLVLLPFVPYCGKSFANY
jgi:hypothetical protein